MAKVITFSRTFPAYHPKAGQPTYFVERFQKSICDRKTKTTIIIPDELLPTWNSDVYINGTAKHHTIRAGHRWNVGDKFSPRVWGTNINPKSGRSGPYHSDQIIIASEIEIKKLWNIEISSDKDGCIDIGIWVTEVSFWSLPLFEVASNDGLTMEDMKAWFNVKPGKPFHGQIICWNESVDYDK